MNEKCYDSSKRGWQRRLWNQQRVKKAKHIWREMEGVQFWTRGVPGGDPDLEYGRETALEIRDRGSLH